MPPIPEGAGLVAHRYTIAGDPEPMLTTLGVVLEDPDPFLDCVNDIDAAWKAELAAMACDAYQLDSTVLYVGEAGGATSVYESTNAAVPGAISGNALPQNNALLVTKVTALSGRRMRGRMFIPAVQAAAVTETGTMSGSTIDTWQPMLDDYLTAVNAVLGVAAVLLHGPATEWVLVNGQPRRQPVAGAYPGPTLIASLRLESTISTQRRRLRP